MAPFVPYIPEFQRIQKREHKTRREKGIKKTSAAMDLWREQWMLRFSVFNSVKLRPQTALIPSLYRFTSTTRIMSTSAKITTGAEKPVKKARTDNGAAVPDSLPAIPAGALTKPKTNIDHLKPIVWIDCEMTGLDTFNDHIIEICCIITDKDLNIIDENGYESVIHYDKTTMDSMGEWCIQHHGDSGLTAKVLESTKSLDQVETELLEYISKYISSNKGILAGNSVHMDRIFMCREMPRIIDYLFYRIIDVSSIMEVGKRHNPKLVEQCPKKEGAHTAKKDILESIEQLKWYQENYLIKPESE